MICFKLFTLFPELFPGPLASSITGQALKNNLWKIETINIRNYAKDDRKTVDDTPYGGGAGMILKPDILSEAIDQNISRKTKLIYLSPRGKLFNQNIAKSLAKEEELAFICGRYEGIDQRVIDEYNIEELSIGDYVLSGGELASFVVIDAILRNIEDVLGSDNSLDEESFSINESNFLLEYPHYTRPSIWRGREVPQVLSSGHHQNIKEWRFKKALEITKKNRNDLYQKYLNQKQ